jgi:hypothetical protein
MANVAPGTLESHPKVRTANLRNLMIQADGVWQERPEAANHRHLPAQAEVVAVELKVLNLGALTPAVETLDSRPRTRILPLQNLVATFHPETTVLDQKRSKSSHQQQNEKVRRCTWISAVVGTHIDRCSSTIWLMFVLNFRVGTNSGEGKQKGQDGETRSGAI